MTTAPRARPAILLAALGLGVAADGLFRAPEPGLNVAVFLFAIAAWATRVARRYDPCRVDRATWPALGAMAFAAMWAVRASETLLAWDLLASLLLLTLPLVQARGVRLATAGALEMLTAPPRTALASLRGALALVVHDVPWSAALGSGRRRTVAAALGGLLLALPLAGLFTALFASADPMFAAAATSLLRLDLEPLASHAIPIAVVTLLSGGYLRTVAFPTRSGANAAPALPSLGALPILIALGAVAFVFTVFVAVQAGSLFRGEAFVRAETGLTFAEYARAGFFQLVAASGLALPLVYAAPWLAGGDASRPHVSLRALQALQLGLIALVAASALWRLRVYVGAYGLTEDRLYATAIVVWVLATVGVFSTTLMAGRAGRAARGVVFAAMAVLGLLNAADPGALIARVNLGRQHQRELDVKALAALGADAVPTIVSRLPALEPATRCAVAMRLAKDWSTAPVADWRGWNLSRARARALVAQLEAMAGECGPAPESGPS